MRLLPVLLLLSPALFANAQELEWSYPLDSPGFAPILFPNATHPAGIAIASGKHVALLDGLGAMVWKTDFENDLASPVTVADINGDDNPELAVITTDASLICLDAAGRMVWKMPFNTPSGGFKHIVAADVLKSPGRELLIGFDDGWLNCVSGSGKLLWRFFGDKGRVGGIAIADTDRDGAPEVVYGTDNGHVYCLTPDGRVKWRYDELAPYGRSGPNIADTDGDGTPEIYITRSNVGNATCLMALNAPDGKFLWRSHDIQQGYVSNAFADLDQDGRLEIIHGDKGNVLYCENPNGSRRWQTELGGRGIFWAPAIADIDGDGSLEIIVGMRGADNATGASVYVVGADGSVKSTIKAGTSANATPAVGDIDGDGSLEIVVVAEGRENAVQCYSWGKGGKVAWPCIRGDSAMTASSNVSPSVPEKQSPHTQQDPRMREVRHVLWGENTWHVGLPSPASPTAFAELTVRADGQPQTAQIADIKQGATGIDLYWTYAQGERARVEVRLFENNMSSVAISTDVIPEPPDACGMPELESGVASMMEARRKTGLGVALPARKLASLRMQSETLNQRKVAGAPYGDIAEAATALRKHAAILRATLDTLGALGTSDAAAFACWVDANPWDHFDALQPQPPSAGTSTVRVTAYRNEVEDAAVTLFDLTAESLDVRCQFFEPMVSQGRPPGDPPATRCITLRRLVPVQSGAGDRVWDPLPELDLSRSITIPSGEARQLWLTIDTHGMAPGTHTFTLFLTTLGTVPYMRKVPIEITVWPAALDDTVYRKMNWIDFNSATASDQAVRDMIDHGINTIYGPPLPAIPVDARGNLNGAVDWAAFDASLARIPKHFFLLWGGPAPLKWPDTAPGDGRDALMNGLRTAIHEMNAHLAPLGFSYDQWAFYPMDEPWNTGQTGIPQLKSFCERVKKAEPQAQIYADPAGSTRIEYVQEFRGLIDVWQPEMNILKRDPSLAKWFMENSRHFWAYEATGPAKQLLPLGYYRAYAWLAWLLGTEGAGYWVYRGEDTWWPVTGGDWSAVYQSNENVVPSRRYEADRDGLEDFRAFHLLRAEAETAGAAGHRVEAAKAIALLDEAVQNVVGWQVGTIDEITRFTRDYELDYRQLLEYRSRIAEAVVRLQELNVKR